VRKVSLVPRRGEAGSHKGRGGVGGSGGDAAQSASDGDETDSAAVAAVYACGDAAYNRPERHRDPQARDCQLLACHLSSL
jgi:hypothetical protein